MNEPNGWRGFAAPPLFDKPNTDNKTKYPQRF